MSQSEKLIFSSSVEALLQVAGGRASEATSSRLRDFGMVEGALLPAYPAHRWASAVGFISADLWPGVSADEQHRKLGEATVKRFADTFMGKAMFKFASVLGARRSLSRMTHNLRTGANFIEAKFTTLDETTHELWINDVSGVPGFYAGLIGAGVDSMKDWPDRIAITQRDGPACTYRLKRSAEPTSAVT